MNEYPDAGKKTFKEYSETLKSERKEGKSFRVSDNVKRRMARYGIPLTVREAVDYFEYLDAGGPEIPEEAAKIIGRAMKTAKGRK